MQSTSPLAQIDAELATEVYLKADQLLRDVLDYLTRLPRHPMTTELIRKISDHLDDPTAGVVLKRKLQMADAQEADLFNRVGVASYTADGAMELVASVGPTSVRLTSPAAARYIEREEIERGEALAFRLFEALAQGITFDLGDRKGWRPADPSSKPLG